METVQASILEDGKVIANDVTVELEVTRRGWQGQFTLPSDKVLKLQRDYEMKTADGREGLFVLSSVPSNIQGMRLFIFKGNGYFGLPGNTP